MAARMTKTQRRADRRARGLCQICGDPVFSGYKTNCLKHAIGRLVTERLRDIGGTPDVNCQQCGECGHVATNCDLIHAARKAGLFDG